jgi:hypothetical protein
MKHRDILLSWQENKISRLQKVKEAFIAEGNEYAAHQIDDEIIVAKSLARLIHKG